MLEANPALTPNAVKAILQYTAQTRRQRVAARAGRGLRERERRAAPRALLRATRRRRRSASRRDTIAGQSIRWARHLIWGNYRVTGGVPLPGSNAWAGQRGVGRDAHAGRRARGVGRGQSRQRGVGRSHADNVVWGERETSCGRSARQRRVGRVGHGDNVVWGESRRDNVVWGEAHSDNVVWGEACGRPELRQRRVGRSHRQRTWSWGEAHADRQRRVGRGSGRQRRLGRSGCAPTSCGAKRCGHTRSIWPAVEPAAAATEVTHDAGSRERNERPNQQGDDHEGAHHDHLAAVAIRQVSRSGARLGRWEPGGPAGPSLPAYLPACTRTHMPDGVVAGVHHQHFAGDAPAGIAQEERRALGHFARCRRCGAAARAPGTP